MIKPLLRFSSAHVLHPCLITPESPHPASNQETQVAPREPPPSCLVLPDGSSHSAPRSRSYPERNLPRPQLIILDVTETFSFTSAAFFIFPDEGVKLKRINNAEVLINKGNGGGLESSVRARHADSSRHVPQHNSLRLKMKCS